MPKFLNSGCIVGRAKEVRALLTLPQTPCPAPLPHAAPSLEQVRALLKHAAERASAVRDDQQVAVFPFLLPVLPRSRPYEIPPQQPPTNRVWFPYSVSYLSVVYHQILVRYAHAHPHIVTMDVARRLLFT